MRPIYNSVRIANQRDIKSVDRDTIYSQATVPNNVAQYVPSEQICNTAQIGRNTVIMGLGHKNSTHKHRQSLMNAPFIQNASAVNSRDIRSCEREYVPADHSSNLSQNNTHKPKTRTNTTTTSSLSNTPGIANNNNNTNMMIGKK